MKKYLRVASGLTGLVLAIGVGAGAAQAESRDAFDVTSARAYSKPVVRGTASAAKAGKTGTGLGFTGTAGTKSYRLQTSVASTSYGRRDDDASLVITRLFKLERSAPAAGLTSKPYSAKIASYARANGVPVALAMAVVRVESNYNPRTRGRAGEIGLMQIKPQTARGLGFSGSASALYDPDTNLRWGMKYLAGAYKLAGGDVCGTVMRYQGGHYARRMSQAAVVYCGKVKRHMAGKWA